MAGAGGLFVMLIGVLIGIAAGIAAAALFAFGFPRMRPEHSRVAAYLVGVVALVAQLLTLPMWIVIISGKDTHGEVFSRSEIEVWVYILLLMPPVTLVALVTRLIHGFKQTQIL